MRPRCQAADSPDSGARFRRILLALLVTGVVLRYDALAQGPFPTAESAPPTFVSGLPSPRSLYLPAGYRAGRLLLRDDAMRRLERALVEIARRRNGRRMIDRILRSGFVTILTSCRLRGALGGLWGPIVFHGETIGAVLYLDMAKILGNDLDPSGVETLAHELRHQVDASRAFERRRGGTGIHSAALAGDHTRSAQRFGHRLRLQLPDIGAEEAQRWLEGRLLRHQPRGWPGGTDPALRSTAY